MSTFQHSKGKASVVIFMLRHAYSWKLTLNDAPFVVAISIDPT